MRLLEGRHYCTKLNLQKDVEIYYDIDRNIWILKDKDNILNDISYCPYCHEELVGVI